METIIKQYNSLFPQITWVDWFYCLLGLVLHAYLKIRHIDFKTFKLKVFINDFAPVWVYSVACIIICMGTLPTYIGSYNHLDSALIGYSCGSFFKQLFKERIDAIGLKASPKLKLRRKR